MFTHKIIVAHTVCFMSLEFHEGGCELICHCGYQTIVAQQKQKGVTTH